MKNKLSIAITIVLLILASCRQNSSVADINPVAALDSIHQRLATGVMYEVNIRQITPEGTFKAFTEQHITRLKKLGVDVLWLMPTYPISLKNRKGLLGSYYSVADYKGINPEFGNLQDLKDLVGKAHENGMLVIFDWVANHSGWDNHWITEHPEWYTHNAKEKIISPVPDWKDVADLNYDNPGLRNAMTDAMEYWIKEVGIDGYRCDAAAMAPTGFWKTALGKLDSIRPVIKLAEAWEPELMANGFNACYGWDLFHLMNDMAKGTKKVTDLKKYFERIDTLYAPHDMLLNFITNHDENSWSGTEYERMGNGVNCFAAFCYVVPGIPLIYTGQEASLKKRLRFFERDTVTWNDTTRYTFYRKLNRLKHQHIALDAGIGDHNFQYAVDSVNNTAMVLRTAGKDKVMGIFNFSDQDATVQISNSDAYGTYIDVLNGTDVDIKKSTSLVVKPWGFYVLTLKK
jgi:cyclomaltodextrinase / maltogenic alpha-amylase / neopullulanase